MTWSYTPPNASGVFADPISEVRYLIDDTIQSDFSLSDEEITYLLAESGDDVRAAASRAAHKTGVKYSKQATTSKTVGDLSISNDYKSVAEAFYKLALDLGGGGISTVAIGGGFMAVTPNQFRIGQFDDRRS